MTSRMAWRVRGHASGRPAIRHAQRREPAVAAPASKEQEPCMKTACDAPMPATLLFPPGWKTNALEWMIIRIPFSQLRSGWEDAPWARDDLSPAAADVRLVRCPRRPGSS